MKGKGRLRFRYYVMFWFLFCVILCNFSIGFYDGFCYGETGGHGGGVWDNVAYLLIEAAVSLLFFWLMNRKIARPLEAMAHNMEKIAQGDLAARAEEDMPFEFRQMEDAFNAMASALQRAEEERRRQEQNNRQLYANIEHDLKSPITMILGYGRTLERGVARKEEQKQEYLRILCEQTEHVNALLDELLAYTRLENQSFLLEVEERDLAETLRSCVAQYYPAFEKHGTVPDVSIPEAACRYRFDAVEMKRVFGNLLSNMLRHTAYKTACRIELEETVCGQGHRACIRIRFADQGERVPEAVKERLFEPFCVGDISRNTRGGSGLGLSIAKKVVERHGGKLFYEEYAEGEGKAFVIELFRQGIQI